MPGRFNYTKIVEIIIENFENIGYVKAKVQWQANC